jgi:ligand-binding SRPBCC domain-containing protein
MSEDFKFRSRMPASADAIYRFHAARAALARWTPPWENARVIAKTGGIEQPGSRTTLRVSVGPFSQDWIAGHAACEPGKVFCDVTASGPFRRWEHTHEFQPESADSGWLEDRVEYEFPLGWLGELIGVAYTRQRPQRMFEWRHRVTSEALGARKLSGEP